MELVRKESSVRLLQKLRKVNTEFLRLKTEFLRKSIDFYRSETPNIFIDRDVLKGGEEASHPSPNIFKIARKLVKSQLSCKRSGHSIFRGHFVFSSSSWSNGQNFPNGKCFGTSLFIANVTFAFL